MVRPYRLVRANVGRRRILHSDTSSQASFERNVREQINGILENFKGLVEHLGDNAGDVLVEALQPTFEKSQALVPVDTRALKNSGYLVSRKFRGRTIVEIGYARGGSPPYAANVHEDVEVFHAAPTQAKFLEQPLAQDAEAIQQRIVRGFREASGA